MTTETQSSAQSTAFETRRKVTEVSFLLARGECFQALHASRQLGALVDKLHSEIRSECEEREDV